MSVDSKMTAIADAIRAKTGGTEALTLDGMAEAIAAIEAGGGDDLADALISRSITEYNDSQVTHIGYGAFAGATKLESVSCPNVTDVEAGAFNMDISVVSLPTVLKTVSFPKLKYVPHHLFDSCDALESINLPSITTINGSYSFNGCASLKSINFPLVESITAGRVFSACTSLVDVSLPMLHTLGTTGSASSMIFSTCAFTSIYLPSLEFIGYNSFNLCKSLVTAHMPKLKTISTQAFFGSYSLKALVIEQSDSICELKNKDAFNSCYHIIGTVNGTYNPDGLKDGYIYVPDALVEDYKVTTNWSIYASQIKPLSEYVEVTE